MKKHIRTAVLAVVLIAALALAGCSTGEKDSSGEAEEGAMKVWGYVASAEEAQLELDETQPEGPAVVVDRVLSPEAAWIVVHVDDGGKPGERIGLAHVDAGETGSTTVELDRRSPSVIVAIHADRGVADEFDFDMMEKETSPDRPFFVDEKELAKVVTFE